MKTISNRELNVKRVFSSILLTFFLASFLNGCSKNDDPPPPKIVVVNLQPIEIKLDVNTSYKFKALATDENGLTIDVTNEASWSLVNNNNTIKFDATDTALVIALVVGADDVTASYEGITSKPTTVTVVQEALTSLAVFPQNVTMLVTTTLEFKVVGTYDSGRIQDLTNQSIWVSSNPTFVTMDGNIASAIKGGATSNITATYEGMTSPDATAEIFDVITRLEMTPAVTVLYGNDIQRYKALAYYLNSTEPQILTNKVTWETGNSEVIAKVFPKGPAEKGYFQALLTGTTFITASYPNSIGGSISATQDLTVFDFFIESIEVRPATTTIKNGTTQLYEVFAIGSNGNEYNLETDTHLNMTVSKSNLAYIEIIDFKTWRLTATGVGSLKVNAEYLGSSSGTFTDSADLVITAP
ncbi:MAG: hypothetical protein ACC653_02505 [Gammaproteobacteria bacterium]